MPLSVFPRLINSSLCLPRPNYLLADFNTLKDLNNYQKKVFCQPDSQKALSLLQPSLMQKCICLHLLKLSCPDMFVTESLESHQVQAFLEKQRSCFQNPKFLQRTTWQQHFLLWEILTWAGKGEAPVSFWIVFQEIWVFGGSVLETPLPIHIQNSGSWQGCFLCSDVYTVKRNWSLQVCYSILECCCRLWTKANLCITGVLICVTNPERSQSS